MSDKALHVMQVLGTLTIGSTLAIVGAVTVNPLLISFGSLVIGAAVGNAAPTNMLSRLGNGNGNPPTK